MVKKQMPKKKNQSTKTRCKDKVCRRCELSYSGEKLGACEKLDEELERCEIKSVYVPKEEQSIWQKLMRKIRSMF